MIFSLKNRFYLGSLSLLILCSGASDSLGQSEPTASPSARVQRQWRDCDAELIQCKTVPSIQCPDGAIEVDQRDYGGEDYCELVLPGSIRVNHGPYRFWFNPDFLGVKGLYRFGQPVGLWRDCDRFNRCKITKYAPESQGKPALAVGFRDGKYYIDFSNCLDTDLSLEEKGCKRSVSVHKNASGDPPTCLIHTHCEETNSGDAECGVPYSVGIKALNSLDIGKEIPEFCGKNYKPEKWRLSLIYKGHGINYFSWSYRPNCARLDQKPHSPKVLTFHSENPSPFESRAKGIWKLTGLRLDLCHGLGKCTLSGRTGVGKNSQAIIQCEFGPESEITKDCESELESWAQNYSKCEAL